MRIYKRYYYCGLLLFTCLLQQGCGLLLPPENEAFNSSGNGLVTPAFLQQAKEQRTITLGGLLLEFAPFEHGKHFEFDRRSGEDFTKATLLPAQDGYTWLCNRLAISFPKPDAKLPCLFLYEWKAGFLHYMGTFSYRFFNFQEGTDHSFATPKPVSFSIGVELPQQRLMRSVLLVLLRKETLLERQNSLPAYKNTACNSYGNRSLDAEDLEQYEIVTILNRHQIFAIQ